MWYDYMIFYFSVDEHLDPLYFFTIMSNIVMNVLCTCFVLFGMD